MVTSSNISQKCACSLAKPGTGTSEFWRLARFQRVADVQRESIPSDTPLYSSSVCSDLTHLTPDQWNTSGCKQNAVLVRNLWLDLSHVTPYFSNGEKNTYRNCRLHVGMEKEQHAAVMKAIRQDKALLFLPKFLTLHRHISSSFFSYLLIRESRWQAAQNKAEITFVKCVGILGGTK